MVGATTSFMKFDMVVHPKVLGALRYKKLIKLFILDSLNEGAQ